MEILYMLLCLVMLAVGVYSAYIFIVDPAFINNPVARYFNPEINFANKYLTNTNREDRIRVCKLILDSDQYTAQEKKHAAFELYYTYNEISLQKFEYYVWGKSYSETEH